MISINLMTAKSGRAARGQVQQATECKLPHLHRAAQRPLRSQTGFELPCLLFQELLLPERAWVQILPGPVRMSTEEHPTNGARVETLLEHQHRVTHVTALAIAPTRAARVKASRKVATRKPHNRPQHRPKYSQWMKALCRLVRSWEAVTSSDLQNPTYALKLSLVRDNHMISHVFHLCLTPIQQAQAPHSYPTKTSLGTNVLNRERSLLETILTTSKPTLR